MNEIEQIRTLEEKEIKEISNIKETYPKKEEQSNTKNVSLPNWSIEPPIEISRGE